MERKPIQIPSSLNGISTLKDGSLSLSFHTQEVSAEEAVNIMGYRNDFGFLLFKPTAFKDEEVPDYDPKVDDSEKSPSQRLRGSIYALAAQKNLPKTEWTEFYRKEMERVITGYQTKYLD